MEAIALGTDAGPAASHATLILVLITLIVRVIKSDAGMMAAAAQRDLALTFSLGAAALAIERIYYFTARVLKPQGIDLWSMHPAPEVLSILVTVGVYCVATPFMRLACRSRTHFVRRIAFELALLGLCWVGIWWVLK